MSNRHTQAQPLRSHFPMLRLAVPMLYLCALLFGNRLQAQDIHFSQVDVNPILFNPAYSGFFDGNGRFGLNYRNQWASVSKAFQTIAATAEVSLLRRRYFRDGLNVGVILSSDRAGSLRYGTSAANIVLSYYKALDNRNNNFISIALQAGAGQAGYDASDISLYEPGESFENRSSQFFTITTGAAWFYQPNDTWYLKLGIAGHNLNRPNISYLELDSAFIERRFSSYARAEYRHWANVSLLPLVAFMYQNNYRELMLGCDAKWYLSESSQRQISLSAGVHYRWRDAALVEMIVEYNAFLFALTYDANLSTLTPASKSVGAFEMGLVYRLVKNKRVQRKAMPCPII